LNNSIITRLSLEFLLQIFRKIVGLRPFGRC